MRRLFDRVAALLALAGGVLLLILALLTVASIGGRWLAARPITGDVELIQLGTAVAIAFFLPYCQLKRGHLVVDFFTARASPRWQRQLDRVAGAIAALLFLLLAWRAAVAVADMVAASETTMVLAVPLWLPYAAMVPGLALAGIAALLTISDRRSMAHIP